jgi:hypothetical protein
MHHMRALALLGTGFVTGSAVLGTAGSALGDSVSGIINTQWIVATPIIDSLFLPDVLSIDSIVIQIAHTNAHDLAISLNGSALPGETDFDLMFQETAIGGGTDFSMGLMPENGTLANVAAYTFVASGGGGYSAPHTPPGLFNANAWVSGSLPAQDYALLIVETSVIFDGGAIGTWTINYTPVPGPAAIALFALTGMTAKRCRR